MSKFSENDDIIACLSRPLAKLGGGSVATYRNTYHRPGKPEYGPAEYVTDAKPEEYRGHLIYRRTALVWDVVTTGECISQYAGPNGARKAIDQRLAGDANWRLV